LKQPRSRERLRACAALVLEVVREQVHREGGHADVDLPAGGALLGLLTGRTAVSLLVTGEVGRGGVVSATLATSIPLQLSRPP